MARQFYAIPGLIENSFLLPKQKTIATQHAVASGSGILANPLFLTLLCRYVKDEDKPPINDSELLLRHITRLAEREPDYLWRRYGLTPSQLIEGSIRLAVLFAEEPSLSLAPTQDQIAQHLQEEDIPGGELESLLGALIDVKIGRCDVKEARTGDRRFAFAHRRYQETLFVEFLARTPSYLSPRALLTDLRWREYAVTLLQTSTPQVIAPLISEAIQVLRECREADKPAQVLPEYGSNTCYFRWGETSAANLLRLLQDGLCRRIEIAPSALRNQVRKYMEAPWNKGDPYDRLMVLSLGGLLPEKILRKMIEWAIKQGGSEHWNAAFTNSFFLRETTADQRQLVFPLSDNYFFRPPAPL